MQIPRMKKMLDRCRIRATCFQCGLNRFPQTDPVILFSQLEKIDHLPRAEQQIYRAGDAAPASKDR